ncbi:nitroreductase family protein [Patescibacteria group bacterium]|nr:nitroreductase family protein [Patescibacteria group bacterium]
MLKNTKESCISVINTRTCCRSFSDKTVADCDIESILKTGQAAPSAKNRQPYFFIVIKNQQCKKEIALAATRGREKQFTNWDQQSAESMIKGKSKMNSNDLVIAEAPVAILLLRDSDPNYSEGISENLEIQEEQGVACVAYSMMIAAQALGLGMAWMCSVLNIPEELEDILTKYGIAWKKTWQPRVILPVGYSKKEKLRKPKRKELKEVSSWIN